MTKKRNIIIYIVRIECSIQQIGFIQQRFLYIFICLLKCSSIHGKYQTLNNIYFAAIENHLLGLIQFICDDERTLWIDTLTKTNRFSFFFLIFFFEFREFMLDDTPINAVMTGRPHSNSITYFCRQFCHGSMFIQSSANTNEWGSNRVRVLREIERGG